MRIVALLALTLAVCASPAAAQLSPLDLDNLRAQQEAAQRRAIDLDNQIMALEARQRAEQAVRDLDLQQRLPRTVPRPPYPLPSEGIASAGRPAGAAAQAVPSIPDDALAASNRRVEAAAGNRR